MRVQPRVAVAEDDADMRGLVADVLRKDGYSVVELADGRGLRSELDEPSDGPLDLIVADVRMPIVSGIAVLRALREAGDARPVVLMTAFADESVRSQAALLGAILFNKPFRLDDLRGAVRALLARKGD
jgi:DNA-binding response OmpR family regulator